MSCGLGMRLPIIIVSHLLGLLSIGYTPRVRLLSDFLTEITEQVHCVCNLKLHNI